MFSRLTVPGRILIALLVAGAIFGLWKVFGTSVFKKTAKESVTLQSIDLPDAPKNAEGNVTAVAMPTDEVSTSVKGEPARWLLMAWNAQMGAMFANGGAVTTKGSLMEKNGYNLKMERQDDCNQMQAEIIKFANAYKGNPDAHEGAQFVSIMGDGSAAWLAGTNKELAKLGDEYKAKIFYACGRSLGEDKYMGSQKVKDNPQAAKGTTVSAVIRDGDWNIVMKWASDNGIPVNTDEHTYDPQAINFIAANDFIDAAQKYISGYSEERDEVVKGVRTGQKHTCTVDGVATWTPGDEKIATAKGGLVSIVSTREYRAQMPCVIIGIDKYLKDNREKIDNFVTALAQAGDQVKSFSNALQKAADISAKVYKEQDGAYWLKYYKGATVADKTGAVVDLGGSRVNNLGDNLEYFGMSDKSTNVFSVVYGTFGDLVTKLYPTLVPDYPKVADILDLSYIQDVKAKMGSNVSSGDQVKFHDDDATQGRIVSEKSYSIEFEKGEATFTPEAYKLVKQIADGAIIANGLKVRIQGHTDNTGSPEYNMDLSKKRADAVKLYFTGNYPNVFPEGRVTTEAFGQSMPIASNKTEEGKKKNRRVTILFLAN